MSSRFLAGCVILIGGAGLAGWLFEVPALTRVLPGLATMKVNTALGFVFSGAALWLMHPGSPRRARIAAKVGAGVVLGVGLLSLSQDLWGWQLGIDELFVADPATPEGGAPGRMSPASAFCFILTGGALLAAGAGLRLLAQLIVLLTLCLATFALAGHLYGFSQLYDLFIFSSMAVHTALAFALVSVGILAQAPRDGIVAVLAGEQPGTRLARGLWLPILVAAFLVGGLVEWSERQGLIGDRIDSAAQVTLVSILASIVIWWSARSLNRTHERLLHVNRLYAVLSACNQHIVRIENREALFEGVCQIIVDVGGFSLAWIGLVDEATQRVVPAAHAGVDGAVPAEAVLAGLPALGNLHPIEQALREERPMVSSGSPAWAQRASGPAMTLRRKHHTSAAFPLKQGAQPLGVLVVHAAAADYFGAEETTLLTEIAADVSLALTHLETERQRQHAEAELERREARFRLLFEDNPLPMWVYDLETLAIVEVNEAATISYGYDRKTFLQLRITDLRSPEDVPLLLENLKQDRPSLEHSGSWRHRTRDGATIDVDVTSHLIAYEGRPSALVVAQDVTERHQAEQERRRLLEQEREAQSAAREAQERVAFLFETMSALQAEALDDRTALRGLSDAVVPSLADWCAIDLINEEGSIERVAVAHVDAAKIEAAYDLRRRYPTDPDAPTGVPRVLRTGRYEYYPEIPDALLAAAAKDEVHLELMRSLGLSSAVIVPPAARDLTFGALTLVMAESGRRYEPDDVALAEDLAQRAAIVVDNARLYRQLRTAHDELETRVRERTAQLEAANRQLESFSYSVSHDLRSPLRAIEGFSRVLVEKYGEALNEQGRGYLQRVRVNALHMGALIDDLLQFSRISRRDLNTRVVHPKSIVEQVVEVLAPAYEGRPVDLVVGALPPCMADPMLLRQIYANLIENALKFTRGRDPARIDIGGERVDEMVRYHVADNGAGFEMQYSDKLFGVFQRLHRREDYEGTGVGLAIVHRIVDRHGGEIWAEAELDQGATFYFTLPAALSP